MNFFLMPVQYKDYYKILGVDRNATNDEIKKAYRNLAKKFHPDVSKEKDAEQKYKEINEAYEVLKDPAKRQKYDTLGMNWQAGQDFTPPPGWEHSGGNVHMDFGDMGSFSDFFQAVFGGGFGDIFNNARSKQHPVRRDVDVNLTMSLESILRGGTHNLEFKTQNGTRSINVRLPRGVTEGSKITLKGKSDTGGDINITVHVAKHEKFSLDNYDLTCEEKINAWDAVLGTSIKINTLDGSGTIDIPAGTQDGQKLRLRGKGMPKRDGTNGDLYVKIKIAIPKIINSQQKKLWEELAKLS